MASEPMAVVIDHEARLTPRERDVKALLDQNKTVKQIAKKLKVSPNAVYNYRRQIKTKLADAPAAPSPNGESKAEAIVRISSLVQDAQLEAEDRRKQIDVRMTAIVEEQEALNAEAQALKAEDEALSDKAEALAQV